MKKRESGPTPPEDESGMPTAIMRFNTMRSLATMFGNSAMGIDQRVAVGLQLSSLADGIVTSPREEIFLVGESIMNLLKSENQKDKEVGLRLEAILKERMKAHKS